MLLWLADYLNYFSRSFNVIHYITLRSILAAVTGLSFSLIAGPAIIGRLKRYKVSQIIRDDGPKTHLSKAGTPTMGGIMVLLAITLSTLLWANLKNSYIWITLFVTLSFGAIGWVDDYRKLILKHPKGLAARWKYFWQSVIAFCTATFLYVHATPVEIQFIVPFFKNYTFYLGGFYILLTYFVIVGTSNAVNLTDGLDGLAIMPIILVGGALGIFAYVSGHADFSSYLAVPHVVGVGELSIFCGALVGAGLGFLWFNSYPAEVFMGDVGSLGLGAALGIVAILVRQELVLFIMGGIFVLETISVMLQVASFKLYGKRIFKMAPIHHHFELQGWPEPKVIVRFWIVTVILVLVGLATLKLR